MKLDHLPLPHTRINSKEIKDLYVKLKTTKILEKIGSKMWDIATSNSFSDVPLWAKETKHKINKWDYFKLKVLHGKGIHQQNEKTIH